MDSGNTRILKNTLFLYFRMIIILVVNLYTYRIILQALGVEDFGIYQIVGGIVVLFTFLNGALSAGSSRFITFALGVGDTKALKIIFNVAFMVHLIMAIIIFILLETIGLWYIHHYLVIPEERMFAANWIFQFSVLTCLLSLTQVPYSALIIAHERMDIFAYVGLAEGMFKLLLVSILYLTNGYDKLIFYGLLICLWGISLQFFYRLFCYQRYPESHLMIVKEKAKYKSMLSFSFWDIIGGFSVQGNTQGVNMLINLFFGVVYNASFGLTNQLKGVITQFSSNFMTAVVPQITKSYAEGNIEKFISLINNASKLSFILYILIAVPIYFETDFIIGLWLETVPNKTVLFLQLTILICLIRVWANPVVSAVHASGNIKYLNIYSGGFSVLVTIPVTYIFYKAGFPVEVTFYVTILTSVVANCIELFCLHHECKMFSVLNYIKVVYIPSTAMLLILAIIMNLYIKNVESSLIRVMGTVLISTATISILSWSFLLSNGQKNAIRAKVSVVLSKIKK